MKSEAYELRNVKELRGGDHFCGLFRSEEERLMSLAPFVEQGLKTNCKVVLIQQEPCTSLCQLKAHTALGSRKIDEALAKGQLAMVSPPDYVFKDGLFPADTMIEFSLELEQMALTEGYRMLFIIGEPSMPTDSPTEHFCQFVRCFPIFHLLFSTTKRDLLI